MFNSSWQENARQPVKRITLNQPLKFMVKEALNVLFLNKSDVLRDLLLVLLTTLISQKPQYKANILFWSFPNHVSEKMHFKGLVKVHFPFLALNTSCERTKIREKGNDPEKWSFCLVHSCPHRWSLLEFFFFFFLAFSKQIALYLAVPVYLLFINQSLCNFQCNKRNTFTHILNIELVFLLVAS